MTACYPGGRFGHTITFLKKNAFLLFGGAVKLSANNSIFCMKTNEEGDDFERGASWVASNDAFLCLMDETKEGKCVNWLPLRTGASPTHRAYHSAILIDTLFSTQSCNFILFFGGKSDSQTFCTNNTDVLQIDNVHEPLWLHFYSDGQNAPSQRYGHSTSIAYSHLLLFGGHNGTRYLNDLWSIASHEIEDALIEKRKLNWTQIQFGESLIPSERAFHTAATYNDEHQNSMMLIYGGTQREDLTSSRFYSLQQNKEGEWCWRLLPVWVKCLRETRSHHTMLVIGSKVLLIGGMGVNEEDDISGRMAIYDLETYVFRYYEETVPRHSHQSWYSHGAVVSWGGCDLAEGYICEADDILETYILDLLSQQQLEELRQHHSGLLNEYTWGEDKWISPSMETGISLPSDTVVEAQPEVVPAKSVVLPNTPIDGQSVTSESSPSGGALLPQAALLQPNNHREGGGGRSAGRPMRAAASVALEAFKKLPIDKASAATSHTDNIRVDDAAQQEQVKRERSIDALNSSAVGDSKKAKTLG